MSIASSEQIVLPTTLAKLFKNENGFYEGNLKHYYKEMWFYATNLFNGYHNFRHLGHVVSRVDEALHYYGDRFNKRERRNLLIAALHHDVNHSGEMLPNLDFVQIRKSIEFLREHIETEDVPYLPEIETYIWATEFPWTNRLELSLGDQIMRDADLSQALSDAWIQQVVLGLAQEMRIDRTESMRKQIVFQRGLSFKTEWAKEKFPRELIDRKVEEAQEFLELLDLS